MDRTRQKDVFMRARVRVGTDSCTGAKTHGREELASIAVASIPTSSTVENLVNGQYCSSCIHHEVLDCFPACITKFLTVYLSSAYRLLQGRGGGVGGHEVWEVFHTSIENLVQPNIKNNLI